MAKGKVDNAGEIITDKKMGYFVNSTIQSVPGRDAEGNPTGSDVERYTGFNIVTSGVTGGTVAGVIYAGTVNNVTVTETLNVYGGGTYIEQNPMYDDDGYLLDSATHATTYRRDFNANVTNVTVSENGVLNIMAGVTEADEVLSAGVVDGITNSGTLNVSGGLAKNVIVTSDAAATTVTGGVLSGAMVDAGAELTVNGSGSANDVTLAGRTLLDPIGGILQGDGHATEVTVNAGAKVLNEGTGLDITQLSGAAEGVEINSGYLIDGRDIVMSGTATVSGGGTVSNTILSSGTIHVISGGNMSGVSLFAIQYDANTWGTGLLDVGTLGSASNVTIYNGAVASVGGGFRTPDLSLGDAGYISSANVSAGGILTGSGAMENIKLHSGGYINGQTGDAISDLEYRNVEFEFTHLGATPGTVGSMYDGYLVGTAKDLLMSGNLFASATTAVVSNTELVGNEETTSLTILQGGAQNVSAGANTYIYLNDGTTGTDLIISSGAILDARHDVILNGIDVEAGGIYRITVAANTVISNFSSKGSAILGTDVAALQGTYIGATIADGNTLAVDEGGVLTDVTVGAGGYLEVRSSFNAGLVNGTITVSQGGFVGSSIDNPSLSSRFFMNRGTNAISIQENANGVTMSAGLIEGSINGAAGTPYEITGYMYVGNSGRVNYLNISSGSIDLYGADHFVIGAFGTEHDNADTIVFSGGVRGIGAVASNVNIRYVYNSDRGEIHENRITVYAGAELHNAVINYVDPDETYVDYNEFSAASIQLYGGYATNITVNNAGTLFVYNGQNLRRELDADFDGVDESYAPETEEWTVHSAGLDANGNIIWNVTYSATFYDPSYYTLSRTFTSFAQMGNIGLVNGVTVNSGGLLRVEDDGMALNVSATYGGGIEIGNGWASGLYVGNEARLSVSAGASAYQITIDEAQAERLGGHAEIYGHVTSTTIEGRGADMIVGAGGSAYHTLVHSEGVLTVAESGYAENVIFSGGQREDGSYFGGGRADVFGVMNSVHVHSDGFVNVNGTAAYVSETYLYKDGVMHVSRGTADVIHLSGGELSLLDSGNTISRWFPPVQNSMSLAAVMPIRHRSIPAVPQ